MSSQLHRQALMEAFDDNYVPLGNNSDTMAFIISQVVRGHNTNKNFLMGTPFIRVA